MKIKIINRSYLSNQIIPLFYILFLLNSKDVVKIETWGDPGFFSCLREAAKNVLYLIAWPLRATKKEKKIEAYF